ncbi:MAG: NTP transferase domain-containing protein [Eudoraea sp.]|nr:NTP transferase domain-containing protein [Eudoraea sp.]MBT8291699.1 NTP transferase domain-containing protein [Eudoraea sp.]NNL01499.1 NTP transferase domain-containing protein [Eudoraea sp.]
MDIEDCSSHTKLFGLVLSGGKSTRMGQDKGAIQYHDLPQREHLYNLLSQVCTRTFLSIRKDQTDEISTDIDTIIDLDKYKGPFNGLLSAHSIYPEVAWLVIACDLPLIDLNAINQLINLRDTSKIATAFATRESGLPEPLAAIWEPGGLTRSIDYLEHATSSCPRKYLINSDIKLVFPREDIVLMNANSEEDYREVMSKLEAT